MEVHLIRIVKKCKSDAEIILFRIIKGVNQMGEIQLVGIIKGVCQMNFGSKNLLWTIFALNLVMSMNCLFQENFMSI